MLARYDNVLKWCIPIHISDFAKDFGLLSFEWNSIRLGGPARGIVTKTVHKTLSGVVGVK